MNLRDVLSMWAFVAAGGVAGLAFHGFWLFAWVGLALFAWANSRPSSTLVLLTGSYLGGLLFNLLALDWMFGTMAPVLPLALIHILAVAWPAASMVIRHFNLPVMWRIPIAWTIGMAVPVWLLNCWLGPSGLFYMNRFAQTQLDVPIVQLADLGGIALVEFAMAFTAAAVVGGPRVIAGLAVAAAGYYGYVRTIYVPGESLQVALYSHRFEGPESRRADLSVWPEEAVRSEWTDSDWSQLVQRMGSPVVAGFRRNKQGLQYNSVAVADGSQVEYYDKHYVVIGGEAASPIDWIARVKQRKVIFASGDSPRLVRCGELLLALPICYEVTIPQAIIGRPDLIVNPGSELGLVKATGHMAMLNHARLRAIESRRSVVRATVAGNTAIIDGNGHILESQTGHDVVGRVPLDRRMSIFAIVGDWVTPSASMFACLSALMAIRSRRNRKVKGADESSHGLDPA